MDMDPFRVSVDRGRQAEDARVFALSETLAVRLAASLPIEVQQAFQMAGELHARVVVCAGLVHVHVDPSRDFFTGSLHVSHGPTVHAVVVSVKTCYVWKLDLVRVANIALIPRF